jgi:MoaA/NifB/PqqE/SkfB family radical SAM enzyme
MYSNYSLLHYENFADYYSKPINSLYKTLHNLKRESYADNERIVFYDLTAGVKDAYDLLQKVLVALDIPNYFVLIVTNNPNVTSWLESAKNKHISYENTITCELVDDPVEELKNTLTNFNIPDSICVTPWINIEINNDGMLSFCCESTPTKDKNIMSTSMVDFIKSDKLQNIRKQFLSGVKPKACSGCFEKESKGKRSKRLRDNHVYKEKLNDIDWHNEEIIKPTVLDIKLGYFCNLSCRICNPENSSSWYTEVQNNRDKFNYITIEPNRADWTVDKDSKFWNELKLLTDSVRYLTFAGGEPLLVKKHFEILEHFIQMGAAKDIKLHYNTNGTVFPSQAIGLWNEFKNVEFTFSIDNIGNKFEYERYGADWKNVNDKLVNFSQLPADKYTLNIYCTLSALNVADAYSVYEFGKNLNMNVEYNILQYPKEFDMRILTSTVKDFIINKFLAVSDEDFNKKIQLVIALLRENIDKPINDFFTTVNVVDEIRKQKFSEIYPELYNLLERQ